MDVRPIIIVRHFLCYIYKLFQGLKTTNIRKLEYCCGTRTYRRYRDSYIIGQVCPL